MGKFNTIKKSRKTSPSTIDEKIELLNRELVKTGMISEITNSTSYVYTVTQDVPPVSEVPPTLTNVPDTTGILGDNFTQPTYGGVAGNNNTWATGWSSNDYLKNPNELAGETGRPIVASVPNSPYDSGGAGIVQYGGYFGTSVGYITAGNKYKQILIGGLIGGTEDPTSPNARSPGLGGVYGGLTDAQFNYAKAFWGSYQTLVNQYGLYNLPGKSVKVWIDYNRFHHFQSGGEFATWTGGPKRTVNGNSEILVNVYIIGGSNKYTSNPGSPYQPGYTTVVSRNSLSDGSYYSGPIPSKIGDKWGLSKEAYNKLKEIASHDKPFSKYPPAGGSDKWPGLPPNKLDLLHPSKDPQINIPTTPFGLPQNWQARGNGSLIAGLGPEEVDYAIGAIKGLPPGHPVRDRAIDALDKWAKPGSRNRDTLIKMGIPLPGV